MRTLTKNEAIQLHKKMWRWIAKETKKQGRKVKECEYFEAMRIDENDIPFKKCYCCEFVSQLRKRHHKEHCFCYELCPLDWGVRHEMGYIFASCSEIKYPSKSTKDGYFKQWLEEENSEKAAKLARIIAKLPEKN